MDYKEKAIRCIVASAVQCYATGFSSRHIADKDNEDGVINMKIHNVFIAALGPEIQYYSALARSLDSSLGNMLKTIAIQIAKLNYEISHVVHGVLYKAQIEHIAYLIEEYECKACYPFLKDYKGNLAKMGATIIKSYGKDYHIVDEDSGRHYLVNLNTGGDLDCVKARMEKTALLEQYCLLANEMGGDDNIEILFATIYNRYGEGNAWENKNVLQYFSKEELCISADFWNFVCKSPNGFDIVNDEIRRNEHYIWQILKEYRRIKMRCAS